ncbi:peptide methionine sulfoxide reductase MsrA-like [Conger conger]|uniref:peptide methionine sulfoxide reductase MsrA-like n=1 Tax=Conger conger TaxID=82655 RepID=UPI002A5A9A22|nr:peptide methionine sulfoxide reductase MsrA-like [Conger conger]
MKNKLPLPTCLLINARSLRGKTDELTANLRHLHEYRTACVMAITETWLDSQAPSSQAEPAGFTAYRMDRDSSVTGKSRGGGVCLLIRDECLRTYYQYVKCHTRKNKILDMCYGTVKGAYSASSLPPLGASDHNVVYLRPAYQRLLKREKPQVKTVLATEGYAPVTTAIREAGEFYFAEDYCRQYPSAYP